MIKSVNTIRVLGSAGEYKTVSELFAALGFELGKEWKNGASRGQYFLAPVGKLEFIDGKETFPTDLWVEVSDLDTVHGLLEKRKIRLVSGIEETDWDSRVLVAEPAKDVRVAFWQPNLPRADAIEGELNSRGMRFAIVISRWNSFITERLLQGALDALRRSGCQPEDVVVVRVPGAFEIPSQSRTLAETGNYDAIITLGCLIRGETTHYEHISTEVTRGIGQSAQETGVPHTYGVLTCENLEQAVDRAGLKAGNKGFEAAISAVEMVSLKQKTGSTLTAPIAARTKIGASKKVKANRAASKAAGTKKSGASKPNRRKSRRA
ncbi:MAG TPA: 6,7-dimethyl-8-ribityllumazine synthase [Candidatus Angelobacter sp.]|nr:6,7-dimethyl-8-ribityllumazine synthase [Candidatus Angelobacter sp.]